MNITSQAKYKTYKNISRYTVVPTFYNELDNTNQSGFPVQIDPSSQYVLHKVVPGDSLDSISLYYYGNPTYYWIIADFNNILDPSEQLKLDSQLKIPNFSTIKFKE